MEEILSTQIEDTIHHLSHLTPLRSPHHSDVQSTTLLSYDYTQCAATHEPRPQQPAFNGSNAYYGTLFHITDVTASCLFYLTDYGYDHEHLFLSFLLLRFFTGNEVPFHPSSTAEEKQKQMNTTIPTTRTSPLRTLYENEPHDPYKLMKRKRKKQKFQSNTRRPHGQTNPCDPCIPKVLADHISYDPNYYTPPQNEGRSRV